MLLFYHHCNRGVPEKYICHMLEENKSDDAGQEYFLGAFHNNIQKFPQVGTEHRASSRLPWLPDCKIMQYFNISAHFLTLHQQDIWGTKRCLFQHHLAEPSEEEHNWSMRFSGHWLFPMKNQYLGLREGNLGPQQCWQRTAKPCWGSTARSWHTALCHRTDKCPARGQGSLFVLNHRPTPLPVQAKNHHQGLSASCFPKFFQTEGKSISHHYREFPLIQLFPLRSASAFLEGTWHSLKTSWKGKTRLQPRERQRRQLRLRKPISTADSISWGHLWCWQAVLLICKDTETKLAAAWESSQDSCGDKWKEEDSLVFLLCLPMDVEI